VRDAKRTLVSPVGGQERISGQSVPEVLGMISDLNGMMSAALLTVWTVSVPAASLESSAVIPSVKSQHPVGSHSKRN
jgi:hypothetical protein